MKYLIAVDSSDNSKFAFRYAKKCFFTEHDHVYILTVAETPTTYPFEDMLNFNNNIYEEMNQKIDQMYSDMLKRYGRKLTRAKIPHTCLIAKGSIKDVICGQAQDLTVDVVVMGRRGLGKLERTFIGSTSQYCVHNLGCSVMVIPETAMKNLSPSSSDEELQSQQMAEMENRVGKETQKAEGSPFVDNPYERAQERIGKGECGHPECGTDECRRAGKKERKGEKGECGHPECGTDECRRAGKKEWKGEKGECGHPECGSGECKRGEMKSKKEHKEKGGKDIKKGPKEESKHEGVGKKEKAGKQEWAGEKGECGHPECGTDECKRGEIKEGGKQEWSGDKSKEKHGSEKKERQGESKKGAKQDRSGKKGEWTGEKGQQIGKGECGHPECGTDECRRVGKKEWKGEKGECGHPECGTDECRRVGKKEWKGQKGECGHPECGSGECKRGEMKSKKEHKEKGEKEKGLELPGGKSYAGVVAASKDKPSPELSLKQAKEEMSKYEGKKEEKSEQQMEAPAQKL